MKKVLIADDSVTTRAILKMTLDRHFSVSEAGNGEEALVMAREGDISYFLMDVYMPVMGGIETIMEIRKIDGYEKTPIIVLTTDDSEDVIRKGREAGATAWIRKPFDPEMLINTLSQLS